MKSVKPTWIENILFVIIIIAVFFFLDLHKLFFSGPFGIHFMRQTDSLSFASNYFNNGFKFFEPELYNLKNIDGKAISEFPITYYITALFYTIFGKQFYIQRIVHLVIAYFGVFAIFRIGKTYLKDFWYALIISITIFTSTVFNYYSFNYLPDIPALGFAFLGWYFTFNYQTKNKNSSLIYAFIFFGLSSLVKITYLINPIAVLVFAIVQSIFNKEEKLFDNNIKVILYASISILLVFIWNAYTFYYVSKYNSNSFITRAFPIWNMNKEGIRIVWDHLSEYWYNKYFSQSVFHLFYILFLINIVFYKKSNRSISHLILILFAGGLAYMALFFSQFRDHDYYFLALFPIIFLIFLNGIQTVTNIKNNYAHLVIKLILAVIVIAGINFSKSKLSERMKKEIDGYSHSGLVIENNLHEIDKLNLDKNAKIIVAPDYCQNGGLFFMDRKGWNLKPKQIKIENINNLKEKGAEYIILASVDSTYVSICDSIGTDILELDDLTIYKLKN